MVTSTIYDCLCPCNWKTGNHRFDKAGRCRLCAHKKNTVPELKLIFDNPSGKSDVGDPG